MDLRLLIIETGRAQTEETDLSSFQEWLGLNTITSVYTANKDNFNIYLQHTEIKLIIG